MNDRLEAFKRTKEDWFPSYYTNQNPKYPESTIRLLKVSLSSDRPPSHFGAIWIVYVCGNDDHSMSREYTTYQAAYKMFHDIIKPEYIGVEFLKGNGFNGEMGGSNV